MAWFAGQKITIIPALINSPITMKLIANQRFTHNYLECIFEIGLLSNT